MILLSVFSTLYENLIDTSWLEAVAVIFGLLSVWFAKQENILVFPTGIISVLIYVYICFFAKLYADMGINFFYFVMSVYGWYNWSRKDENKKVIPITVLSRKQWVVYSGATIGFFVILFYVLSNYTDSNVPVWDSVTTAIFLTGMWLMAKKKLENWIFWIAGDLISIPLYTYKDLILTSFQFFVFLIIAVLGYIEWRKSLRLKYSGSESVNIT
jgi:nicotinamide mononucleotide transporter